jgi:ribosome biogenesis ATPase
MLKDLGGIDEAINELLEYVAFPLTHPEVYEFTGVPIPRGYCCMVLRDAGKLY